MYICNDLALIQAAMAEQDWRNDVFASRRPDTANKNPGKHSRADMTSSKSGGR